MRFFVGGTHAIDWDEGDNTRPAGFAYSTIGDWRDSWNREIVAGYIYKKNPSTETVAGPREPPLTNYAAWQPSEGFAEFGRLVFSDPQTAADKFPKCYAFWVREGLAPELNPSQSV